MEPTLDTRKGEESWMGVAVRGVRDGVEMPRAPAQLPRQCTPPLHLVITCRMFTCTIGHARFAVATPVTNCTPRASPFSSSWVRV